MKFKKIKILGFKSFVDQTDIEIEEMQKQINKESGMDPEDGGINLPDSQDGIRRGDGADGDAVFPARSRRGWFLRGALEVVGGEL